VASTTTLSPRSTSPTTQPHAAATRRKVDWRSYASVYDDMAAINPAYAELVARYRGFLASRELSAGDLIVDLGAGTGNFSLEAAALWPGCRVLHVDADEGMNARAAVKREERGLRNLEILSADADAFAVKDGSASVVTAVHALYTFRDPDAVVRRIYDWLRPGGMVFACDPGRVIDVRDWARYLFRASLLDRGLWHTARVFYRAREVARQNRRIASAQTRGTYWLHDLSSFRGTFEAAGFVVQNSWVTYRGISDALLAVKPESDPAAEAHHPSAAI